MAESVIDILIRLKDQTSAALKKLKKNLDESNRGLKKLSDTDASGAVRSLEQVEQQLKEIKDATEASVKALDKFGKVSKQVFAAGAALTAGFGLAAKKAGDFQTEIQEIATLIPDTVQTNEQLRKSVLDLSNEFGADRATVASALYQAISSGAAAGADANDLLRVSLETARGGVTDVRSAVDGLTTVLNAFQLETSQARDVADSLFVAVRGGRTTIGELSQFLFQAAPLANTLGVQFFELSAAIAAITQQGVPTSNAAIQVRAALIGLARGAPEATAALGEFATVSEAITAIGLQETLDRVRAAVGDSNADLIRVVGSIEGLNGILALTGGNSETFTKRLEDQNTRLGAIRQASDEVAESFGVTLTIAINRASNAFVEIGEVIIPLIEPFVKGFGEIAQAFGDALKEDGLPALLIKVAAALGVLLTVLGAFGIAFAVFGKGFVLIKGFLTATKVAAVAATAGIRGATIATRLWTIAIRVLKVAFGPIGLILTALGFAYSAFADDVDDATSAIDLSVEAIEALSNLERIGIFDDVKLQVIQLTAAVQRQIEKVQELQRTVAKGGISGFFAGFKVDNAVEELARLGTALEETSDKADVLQESLFDAQAQAKLSDDPEGLKAIEDQANVARAELHLLIDEFTALRAEATKELPRRFVSDPEGKGFLGGKFVAAEPEGEEGITEAEQAGLDALNQRILAQAEALALTDKFTAATRDLIQARVDLATADAETEKNQLTLKQRTQAAKEFERLLRDQNKLERIEAQNTANVIIDENNRQLDVLADQFERRKIGVEEFYAESERLAKENAIAELKVLETQLRNIERERQASVKVAEVTAAGPSEFARIDAQFDAQEAILNGRVQRLGAALLSDIQTLGRGINDAVIDQVSQSVDDLLAQQAFAIQLAQAQLEAGTLTQSQAQVKIAEATAVTNDQLKIQLALIEELLAENPDDPALVELLQRVTVAIATTNEAVTIFAQRLTGIVEGELSNFFDEILQGTDDIAKSFDDLIAGIGDKIRKLIADRLANKLIESLFGGLIGEGSIIGGFLGSGGGYIQAAQGGFIEAAEGGLITNEVHKRFIHAARGGFIEVSPRKAIHRATGTIIRAATGGLIDVIDAPKAPEIEYLPAPKTPYKKAKSGGIMKMSVGGGRVRGRGTATSDEVGPVYLSNGEYVVKTAAVKHYGVNVLEAINQMVAEPIDVQRKLSVTKPRRTTFQTGGLVGEIPSASSAFKSATGGSGAMKLEVSEGALNLTMRDFLEREFGRIMATR